MPYMLTSRGRSSPWRSNQGARLAGSSASPPKITQRRARPGAAAPPSAASSAQRSWRKAEGVWLRTVTRSSPQQAVEALGRAALPVGDHHQPAAVEQRAPDLPDREVEGVGVEEGPDVVRAEAEPGLGRREQADDVGVRDHHPLGPAGRARGVDDVGRELRIAGQLARRSPLAARDRLPLGVEADTAHGTPATAPRRLSRVTSSDAPLSSRMKARRSAGVGGIERHVGGAGLEHGEDGDHHLRRALQQEGDPVPRPHAGGPQMAGQPVGAAVELAVGEPLAVPRQRAPRPRARGPPAPRSGGAGRSGRGPCAGCRVPLDERAGGAPPRSAAAAPRGGGPARRSSAASRVVKWPARRATVAASKRSVS